MAETAEIRGMHAPGGVPEARTALLAWIQGAGEEGQVFLQVHMRATGPGQYQIRHANDVGMPLDELAVEMDPYAARVIAQTTARGEHRPLKTAPNLRRGWAFCELDGRGLWTALEYLYPACAVHWHAARTATLRVTHWQNTAARQSGMYSSVKLLPPGAVRNSVRACCADAVCLRRVQWEISADTPLQLPDEGPVTGAVVPCPEACSLFISFVRQVLVRERTARRPVPGLGSLNAVETAQIRAVVAEAAAGTLGATREGNFAEPTNQRLIRYLAARFSGAAADEEAAGLPCEGCPRPDPCATCPLV